jgi:di-N-acetylchitobiase
MDSVLVLIVILAMQLSPSNAIALLNCPCSDQKLCTPLSTPLPEKEVFVFLTEPTNWRHYNFTYITTIALFAGPAGLDPLLLCYAHSRNIRLSWGVSFGASQLLNHTARSEFITNTVNQVISTYADGINMDFEDPVTRGSADYAALTELYTELGSTLRARVPTAQITFDVAWSPQDIDGRAYNYSAIVALSDFVVIMDYDTRSQVFAGPPCYGGPNAPADTVRRGIDLFLGATQQSAKKFVLGVPWYGYDYACLNANGSLSVAHCEITSVPFRGVDCSDAAGVQYNFDTLMTMYRNSSIEKTVMVVNTTNHGDGLWARFNYKDTAGVVHAVWLDTPQILAEKYSIAKGKGLRGLSMWNVDCLSDAASGPGADDSKAMWSAMDLFFM